MNKNTFWRKCLTWDDIIVPAIPANEEAFQHTFSDDLWVVELTLPFITGHEDLNAPDLIELHIREILAGIRQRWYS